VYVQRVADESSSHLQRSNSLIVKAGNRTYLQKIYKGN